MVLSKMCTNDELANMHFMYGWAHGTPKRHVVCIKSVFLPEEFHQVVGSVEFI